MQIYNSECLKLEKKSHRSSDDWRTTKQLQMNKNMYNNQKKAELQKPKSLKKAVKN